MKGYTIQEFFDRFSSEEACLRYLFNVRFGQRYRCKRCNSKARWYLLKKYKAYSCGNCGAHIHPTAGTIFEKSRTKLQLWFYAIFLFTTTRSGVSAAELQRQLGVTYKTAWRMGHLIRQHMASVGQRELEGEVELDETYIGGRRCGARGRGAAGKTILFGMLDRTGNVITKIVPNVTREYLYPHILENVKRGSTIYTDEHRTYHKLSWLGYHHEQCNHSAYQYAIGSCHTNTLEGFWSRLKLSIRGTYINVSPQHLQKYADEFGYRFNSRFHPHLMFDELMSSFPPPKK